MLSVHRKLSAFRSIAAEGVIRVIFFTVTILLVFFPRTGRTESTSEMFSQDATGFYRDFRGVFSSPAHFDDSDWMRVAAVTGAATLSTLFFDEPVRDFALNHHTSFLDTVMPVGDYYGRFRTGYGIGSLIYLGGILAGADDVRLTGRAVLEAHTIAMMITGVLKATTGRSRPFKQEGNMRFSMFATENPNWSFPSGHATSAFAVSSALSSRIKRPWATVGIYALSTLTAMQRVYDDKHWLSDTIVGAAIGTAVGLAVGNMINDEESRMEHGYAESSEPVPLVGVTVTF